MSTRSYKSANQSYNFEMSSLGIPRFSFPLILDINKFVCTFYLIIYQNVILDFIGSCTDAYQTAMLGRDKYVIGQIETIYLNKSVIISDWIMKRCVPDCMISRDQ